MGNNTWSLVDYFDVWGNAEDVWEVNNASVEFDDLYLDPEITDEELVDYLKYIDYFTKFVTVDQLIIEDGGDHIEFFQASDGKPICRLDRNYK